MDLHEAAGFVVSLCDRMIGMGRVSVRVIPPPEPVGVVTHRFYLQHLLWGCIEPAMKASRPETEVEIHFEKVPQGACVRICVHPAPDSGSLENPLAGSMEGLGNYLGLQPISGLPSGEIGIRLPAQIQYLS